MINLTACCQIGKGATLGFLSSALLSYSAIFV
ncbi:hypothetical protein ROI_14160 [Roseburia intestinalis M50/1]|nr:hypothetical protein ROI_14160 [Roseburia intestinalis M50/1]